MFHYSEVFVRRDDLMPYPVDLSGVRFVLDNGFLMNTRRVSRLPWRPCAVFIGNAAALPYGYRYDWTPLTDILDEDEATYYAWSPFTSAFRAMIAFREHTDAVAFSLART